MIPIPNEAAKLCLVTCLADALQQSLTLLWEQQATCTPHSSSTRDDALMPDDATLSMSARLRGTLHGEVTLHLPLEGSGTVSLGSNEHTSRWQSVLEGMLQYLPKRAADAGMFAFAVESHRITWGITPHSPVGGIDVTGAEGLMARVSLSADEELIESLKVAEWSAYQEAVRSGRVVKPDLQIGRVMNVPLAVTLRFGQRQMRLRDVLDLNTGSLVELDRRVEEPVELMLGERVIARGDVVIVDGNYGLRVSEVVERDSIVTASRRSQV